jgi:hypothetical protein
MAERRRAPARSPAGIRRPRPCRGVPLRIAHLPSRKRWRAGRRSAMAERRRAPARSPAGGEGIAPAGACLSESPIYRRGAAARREASAQRNFRDPTDRSSSAQPAPPLVTCRGCLSCEPLRRSSLYLSYRPAPASNRNQLIPSSRWPLPFPDLPFWLSS